MSISMESIDIISIKLEQAWAISNLLITDGDDEKEFNSPHAVVFSAILSLSSLIDDVREEIRKADRVKLKAAA